MGKLYRRGSLAAVGITFGVAAACGIIGNRLRPGFPVACSVARQECTREELSGGVVVCTEYSPILSFVATTCTAEGDDTQAEACQRAFCGQSPDTRYGYLSCSATDTTLGPGAFLGMCEPFAGPRGALVTYTQRSRTCTMDEDQTCGDSLELVFATRTECVDVSRYPAVEVLQPPTANRDRSVTLSGFQLDHSSCSNDIVVGLTTYALAPGASLGRAASPGAAADLRIAGGSALVQPLVCNPDAGGGFCQRLLRLHADIADLQVGGAQLRSVKVDSVGPTDIQDGTIRPGGLRLVVAGQVDGADALVILQNEAPLRAAAGPRTFSLRGTLSTAGTDLDGRLIPVSITADVLGSAAPPPPPSCGALTPVQRLFGFEDLRSWTSTVAQLSLVTSSVTQGCGALGIDGSGYLPIAGARFSTTDLRLDAGLSVDLFIPADQPNPWWLGALQMFLTCPSGGVFNHYIGQLELTGRPSGRYSTLRFPLSGETRALLGARFSDCAFGFALNVNATGRTWLLDNLRFTP